MPPVTEETPLLRQRAATSGLVRKGVSFRELNASSTMLDRLVYHYDQKPGRQTGFWPKAGMGTAHFSYGDFDDLLMDGSVTSEGSEQPPEKPMVMLNQAAYECLVRNGYPLELEIAAGDVNGVVSMTHEPMNGWPQWGEGALRVYSNTDKKWVVTLGAGEEVLAISTDAHTGYGPQDVPTWAGLGKIVVAAAPTAFLTVAAFLALFAGVTAMSSIGPIATKFTAVNGMLLGCWIAQALFTSFTLLSVCSSTLLPSSDSARPISWLLEWSSKDGPGGLQIVVLSGIVSGVGSGCWTISFSLTPVPMAYLFASFSPSVIVLCRRFASSAGAPPSRFEILGVVVGVLGGFLTCFGSGGSVSGTFGVKQLAGNLLAFVCSISNAVCGMCGKFASCVPTVHYLSGVCLLSAITQGCLAWVALPSVTLTADPYQGVFGWTDPMWHTPFALLVLSFMVGQWGIFFFLQVGTALEQAAVMTTQPIIATILGVTLYGTQQAWPDYTASIGGLTSIAGSLIVIISGYQHEIPSED
eukprot:TRINITY_DN10295_c0_g1_i1.p1 TRINITY_DN10295_c0_g1~~TRINITY_DN10295_c0_g1_i1.p1  ORF type:complete len:525 (+),score=-0.45 TRINITY_DN10295_c0_g1_i1:73-1647(+)